jgi:hypothetical protein
LWDPRQMSGPPLDTVAKSQWQAKVANKRNYVDGAAAEEQQEGYGWNQSP